MRRRSAGTRGPVPGRLGRDLVLGHQRDGYALWMQGDGNLVLYTRGGTPIWNSATNGHPGAWLAVQDDGNVVIYDGPAIWSTGTPGR